MGKVKNTSPNESAIPLETATPHFPAKERAGKH
jgi:hypothetical protein